MIRYKKLGYAALNVTDLEKSANFYENIVGLQPVAAQSHTASKYYQVDAAQGEAAAVANQGPAFFTCSRDHHNIVLYPAKEPGLKRVGFEVENEEQLDIAFETLTKAGVNPVEVSKEELQQLSQGRSIRFIEPNSGICFEFYNQMMFLGAKYDPKFVQIRRLGHVVVEIQQFEGAVKFLREVMNFKISDHFGEKFVFMRCFPNPYHHTFAVQKGNTNRLGHVNFMVDTIDDIGVGRNRMIEHDVPIVYGPGRHEPSDSIFLYYLDPDGMTLEYSFGMEEFSETTPRKPRLLEFSRAIGDRWGGKRDPRMSTVGRIFSDLD